MAEVKKRITSWKVIMLPCELRHCVEDAVLLQGGPRDAAVNFGTCRSLQQHRVVFTAIATLSN